MSSGSGSEDENSDSGSEKDQQKDQKSGVTFKDDQDQEKDKNLSSFIPAQPGFSVFTVNHNLDRLCSRANNFIQSLPTSQPISLRAGSSSTSFYPDSSRQRNYSSYVPSNSILQSTMTSSFNQHNSSFSSQFNTYGPYRHEMVQRQLNQSQNFSQADFYSKPYRNPVLHDAPRENNASSYLDSVLRRDQIREFNNQASVMLESTKSILLASRDGGQEGSRSIYHQKNFKNQDAQDLEQRYYQSLREKVNRREENSSQIFQTVKDLYKHKPSQAVYSDFEIYGDIEQFQPKMLRSFQVSPQSFHRTTNRNSPQFIV